TGVVHQGRQPGIEEEKNKQIHEEADPQQWSRGRAAFGEQFLYRVPARRVIVGAGNDLVVVLAVARNPGKVFHSAFLLSALQQEKSNRLRQKGERQPGRCKRNETADNEDGLPAE